MDNIDATLQRLIAPLNAQVVGTLTLKFAAVIVVDEAQKIVYASEFADKLFAYPIGGLKGRPLDELIPDSVRENHGDYVRMFFSGASTGAHAMGKGIPRKIFARPFVGDPFPVVVTLNLFAEDLRNYTHALIQRVAEEMRPI